MWSRNHIQLKWHSVERILSPRPPLILQNCYCSTNTGQKHPLARVWFGPPRNPMSPSTVWPPSNSNRNHDISEDSRLVSEIHSRQRLRSASSTDVVVPATRWSSLGDRAFPVAWARAWNALPPSVTSTPSPSLHSATSENFSVSATTAWIISVTDCLVVQKCLALSTTLILANWTELNWNYHNPNQKVTWSGLALKSNTLFHMPPFHRILWKLFFP